MSTRCADRLSSPASIAWRTPRPVHLRSAPEPLRRQHDGDHDRPDRVRHLPDGRDDLRLQRRHPGPARPAVAISRTRGADVVAESGPKFSRFLRKVLSHPLPVDKMIARGGRSDATDARRSAIPAPHLRSRRPIRPLPSSSRGRFARMSESGDSAVDGVSGLFDRARSGDQHAWRELFDACYPKVIRAIRRRLNSQAMRSLYDSTDFVGDVWKSLAEKPEKFDFANVEVAAGLPLPRRRAQGHRRTPPAPQPEADVNRQRPLAAWHGLGDGTPCPAIERSHPQSGSRRRPRPPNRSWRASATRTARSSS